MRTKPFRRELTLKGLYNSDNNLFNAMSFPEGVEKDLFVDTLLYNYGEFPLVYTDGSYLRHMFGVWSRRNAYMISGLFKTTQFAYNPIFNKDGTVTETRTAHSTEAGVRTPDLKSETVSTGGYTDTSASTTTDAGTSEESAITRQQYAPANASTLETQSGASSETGGSTSGQSDYTGSTTRTMDGLTDTSTTTGTDSSRVEGDTEETLTRRESGNIGVTTTQEMIQAERDIVKYDFYLDICRLFAEEFCVMLHANFWDHNDMEVW